MKQTAASWRRLRRQLRDWYAGVAVAEACAGRTETLTGAQRAQSRLRRSTLVSHRSRLARKENRSCETGAQLLQRILKERSRGNGKEKGKYKEPMSAQIVRSPAAPGRMDMGAVRRAFGRTRTQTQSLTYHLGANLNTHRGINQNGSARDTTPNIGDGTFHR